MRPGWPRVLGYVILWALGLLPHAIQMDYGGPVRTLLWLAAVSAFFAAAMRVGRWIGAGDLKSLGLRRHDGWGRNLAVGASFGVLLTGANFGLRWWLGRYAVAGFAPLGDVLALSAWCLVNAGYSAVWEELLGRGYVLRSLPQSWSPVRLAVVSAVIFTGFHLPKLGAPWQSWAFWFVSGLVLATAYLMTGSLWFSVGLHWAQNTLAFALLEGRSILVMTEVPGYPWPANFTNLLVIVPLLGLVALVCRRISESGDSHVSEHQDPVQLPAASDR